MFINILPKTHNPRNICITTHNTENYSQHREPKKYQNNTATQNLMPPAEKGRETTTSQQFFEGKNMLISVKQTAKVW